MYTPLAMVTMSFLAGRELLTTAVWLPTQMAMWCFMPSVMRCSEPRPLVNNVDVTVVAQRPRLAPHVEGMCEVIARDLQLDRAAVNVKATTTEGLGYVGREEGIACHAVVLLTTAPGTES